MNKGTIQQKGTPAAPNLVIKDSASGGQSYAIDAATLGAGPWLKLLKGESRPVCFLVRNRRVVAVAGSAEELRGLVGDQPSPPPPVQRAAPAQQPPRSAPAVPPKRVNHADQPRTFHNPYGFVPFVPRPSARDIETAHPGLSEVEGNDALALLDGAPPGHQEWRADRWHGHVEVVLETVTPLLTLEPETARAPVRGETGHLVLEVLTRDGAPWLPATGLKGALRAAFECLTSSRLPRFDSHEGRLGYRRAASSALEVEGFRVKAVEPVLELELFKLAALPRYAARVPDPRGGFREVTPLRCVDTQKLPVHGQEIWARVAGGKVSRVTQVRASPPSPPSVDWQRGYAHVTGENISRKHSERFFYGLTGTLRITDPQERERLMASWRDLIDDYREAHTTAEVWERTRGKGAEARRVEPWEKIGHQPGKTAWSPPIWDASWQELHVGTQGYALRSEGGKRIDALYPVLISRELFEVAPRELVPDDMLPAQRHAEFSPADRVFGWVPEGRGRHESDPPYRGHLRIGPGRCETAAPVERFTGDGLPLAILGAPKPRQARFYVGGADGSSQRDGLSRERAGYEVGKVLRGRKVYPHHNGLPRAHWTLPDQRDGIFGEANEGGVLHHREYRRPKIGDREQRDSQNRSIRGWVKPGARFKFRVDLDNLSAVELGALLTLLHQEPGQHLRVGGGKPLGFGSVTCRVVGGLLQDGRAFRARYESLTGPSPANAKAQDLQAVISDLKRRFEAASERVYGTSPRHRAALERALCGHDDNLPTHYPRAAQSPADSRTSPPPTPEGESFKWFVANDRGPGYALADLERDPGLPTLTRS